MLSFILEFFFVYNGWALSRGDRSCWHFLQALGVWKEKSTKIYLMRVFGSSTIVVHKLWHG